MIFINNFAQRALFALKRVFKTRFNSSGLIRKNHSLSVLMDFSPDLPFLFLLRFLSESSEESLLSSFPGLTFTSVFSTFGVLDLLRNSDAHPVIAFRISVWSKRWPRQNMTSRTSRVQEYGSRYRCVKEFIGTRNQRYI